MEWYMILAVIVVGFFAGFINTLAGSGSLISLPMLMFLGLPANVANGTNRVAILLQNIIGVSGFRQQNVFSFKDGIWLAVPAIVGSLIGAGLAVELNEAVMHYAIAGLLVFMFFVILLKPKQWIVGKSELRTGKPTVWQIIIFFFIGIYGGFIQAGVGLFLLAGLVLGAGFDLVKANAVKVFIVLLYTPFALAVFYFNDQINWKIGLILAVGNMAGAFTATRFAVSWGPQVVRYILLIVILGAAVKLLIG
ncbi:MAG: sulfite exporter TauE/SafE family protein [Bacteroidota bacterium]|nr:sulfite exporter TauE/SafE family protein [Bacteroidota bacterium]